MYINVNKQRNTRRCVAARRADAVSEPNQAISSSGVLGSATLGYARLRSAMLDSAISVDATDVVGSRLRPIRSFPGRAARLA